MDTSALLAIGGLAIVVVVAIVISHKKAASTVIAAVKTGVSDVQTHAMAITNQQTQKIAAVVTPPVIVGPVAVPVAPVVPPSPVVAQPSPAVAGSGASELTQIVAGSPTPAAPAPVLPPGSVVADVGNPGAFGPAQDHGWQPGSGTIPVHSLNIMDYAYLYWMDESFPGHDLFFKVLSGSNQDISGATNAAGLVVASFDPNKYSNPALQAAVKAAIG